MKLQLTHVIGIVQSRGLLSHHTGFMSKLVNSPHAYTIAIVQHRVFRYDSLAKPDSHTKSKSLVSQDNSYLMKI